MNMWLFDMPVCSMDFGRKIGNNNYIVRRPVGKHRQPYWDNSQWLHYILVGVAAVGCYVNSLWGEFVHDDIPAIVKNADVRGDTDFHTMFRNDFWGKAMMDNTSHKSYRPLTVLTFRLNHMMSGYSPFSYHIVNVCLHLVASLLFTFVCKDFVFKNIKLASLAGTMFAVHPIHTEAVAGIVGRADVLCAVFYLLSYVTYLGSRRVMLGRRPQIVRALLYPCTLLLAGCAMLAKEQGITVLGVCFCTEMIEVLDKPTKGKGRHRFPSLKRIFSQNTPRHIGLSLTAIIFLYVRIRVQGWQLPTFTEQDNPAAFSSSLLTKLLTYAYLPVLNLWLLICPARMSYDYQLSTVPLIHSFADMRNVGTLVLSVIFCLLSWKIIYQQSSSNKQITVGLLFLVLPFLPASNVLFPVGFVIAERILYLPSMGLIIIIVTGLQLMLRRFHDARILQWVLFIMVCLVLAGRTITRNKVWQTRETLFRSGLVDSPRNAKMHYNYANYLKDQGRYAASKQYYQNAIRLWPNYASAYNNLGTLLNNPAEAERYYRESLNIVPCHANAHFNLGANLWKQSRTMEAIESLKSSMKCDKHSVAPLFILATIYNEQDLDKEANSLYQNAIRNFPTDANVHTHYAEFLHLKGSYKDALSHIKRASEIDPSNHLTLRVAGRLMARIGRQEEARILFTRAMAVSDDPYTTDMAGVFYLKTGNLEKAIDMFQKAHNAEPKRATYGIHLAHSLSEAGRYDQARDALLGVIKSNNDCCDAPLMLASIYGNMKQHKKAVEILEDKLQYVENNGTAAVFYLNLGKHYRDLDNLDLALYHYQQAVLHDPELGEAHHNLGVFYHIQGDLERAMTHYTHAINIQPDKPVLQENMAKLMRAVAVKQSEDFKSKPAKQATCSHSDIVLFENDNNLRGVNQVSHYLEMNVVTHEPSEKNASEDIVSRTDANKVRHRFNSSDSKLQVHFQAKGKSPFVENITPSVSDFG